MGQYKSTYQFRELSLMTAADFTHGSGRDGFKRRRLDPQTPAAESPHGTISDGRGTLALFQAFDWYAFLKEQEEIEVISAVPSRRRKTREQRRYTVTSKQL
jgi:hypothetical protein